MRDAPALPGQEDHLTTSIDPAAFAGQPKPARKIAWRRWIEIGSGASLGSPPQSRSRTQARMRAMKASGAASPRQSRRARRRPSASASAIRGPRSALACPRHGRPACRAASPPWRADARWSCSPMSLAAAAGARSACRNWPAVIAVPHARRAPRSDRRLGDRCARTPIAEACEPIACEPAHRRRRRSGRRSPRRRGAPPSRPSPGSSGRRGRPILWSRRSQHRAPVLGTIGTGEMLPLREPDVRHTPRLRPGGRQPFDIGDAVDPDCLRAQERLASISAISPGPHRW